MRNAAASFDDDFDIKPPARKKAERRPASGSRKKKGQRPFYARIDMKRVARYAAIGMSATVALGIIVNALVLQKTRHPAPLFGSSIALGGAPAARPAPKPLPVARQPVVTEIAPPEPAPKPSIAALLDGSAPSHTDEIARLLQDGGVLTERHDTKTVLAAQKALAKLGFALKPNGSFGPQTKKALEAFEKDRHLPIKGELTHRVLKILAAESGLKIEH